MSQKRWKLVVTELGRATALHEVLVEAGDWMTALTRARAQIGERGGVPPGASCQIAPDGTASITDAVARRKYLIAPTNESKAPPAPTAAPTPAAPVPVPSPVSVPAPVVAAPLTKKQKQQTMAYMPSQHGPAAGAPAPVAVGAAPSPAAPAAAVAAAQPPAAAHKTVSYSTAEVRAAAQAYGATPGAPGGVAPARPASVPPPAAVMPAPTPSKKVAKQTMAYMPPEAMKAIQQAVSAAQAPAAAPVAVAAPIAEPVAVAPPIAAPVAAAAPIAAPTPVLAQAPLPPNGNPADTLRTPALMFDDGLELLHGRDAEPSKESPLVYRERHYLLPPGADPDDAEMLLRRRFAALREELAPRAKGKLVKMALFDHRWSGQPTRPPVLALQWKDWRGEPEITAPTRTSLPGTPTATGFVPNAPSLAPVVPAPAMPAPPAASIALDRAHTGSPSIVIDPSLSAPPPAAPSFVIDPSLTAPAPVARPAPVAAPVAAAQAAPIPLAAKGSSKRDRKLTPAAGLADDRLADAFESLQDLFFLTSAFEGVEFTMRIIGELIPCEALSVALYDINSHELRFAATTGAGAEERKGDAIPTTAGLIGTSLTNWFAPLVVSDVNADARFDPGIDGRVGLALHNMLIMPVAAQGRLLALVQLMNRKSEVMFTQNDANLIMYITSRLGEFLLQTKMAADQPAKKATKGAPR